MAADQVELPDETDGTVAPPRRRWPLAFAIFALILAIAFAWAWASRERLAGNYLEAQLRELGLPATYEIEQVGLEQQVLRNIVIGDPRRPDLTIERAEARLRYRFGFPTIGRITVVRPRLYGSWRGGELSFGSLDKVLFAEATPKQPFRLPDLDVNIVDGRSRLDTDSGPVGLKLVGAGRLRDGFAGTLAGIAPEAVVSGCRLRRATVYGAVAIAAEKPRFTGPLRVAGAACPGGAMIEQAGLQVDATFDKALDGGEATLRLETGAVAAGGVAANRLKGTGRLTYRKQALTARYDLAAESLAASSFGAGLLRAEGTLRSQHGAGKGLGRIELDGTLGGERLALGQGLDGSLAEIQRASADTLLAPMLAQLRAALRRETPGSKLSASYLARAGEGGLALTVPQASLQGGSGQTLLAVSRFQLIPSGGGAPQLSGNLMTGGAGLPQIAGRMERPSGGPNGGGAVLRLTMADYRAGNARLAIPSLTLAQGPGGALGFVGRAVLSGPLPGGAATNLAVPIDGNWSSAGGLSVWRRCIPVAFDRLALANLTIERRSVTLCPPSGGAMVRSTAGGTRFAAGATRLDLVGRLGSTPIRIASGPVGFAMPGALSARSVDIALGPAATASRFRLSNLSAQIGKDIAGKFDGTDVRLAAVPLDLLGARGSWRYAGGVLSIADGTFRLIDRQPVARFEPLNAQDGTLTLKNNVIDANALMTEPTSGREVVRAVIRHDLGNGRGRADLTVPGIAFDGKLQPVALTRLALGVVANVAGSVRGEGTIQWNEAGQTSTGRFTTDDLDFAAVFGPVKGASGTIVFTDLLNLVTAPDQRLRIASINPGIEATDGELRYELRPHSQISVLGARWPFLDGTLTLDPTVMNLGIDETRRYTLRVEGIEAAKFVERLDLGNITATGKFDGVLPLVFDQNGGRIEGGMLTSRPPGGNVSYVGALTYKDLSTMANFAFEALKSLNYKEMRIGMDGALAGEIVTRVRFTGVTQGAGTKQNFLTKRLANLPIQFNINIRASFIELVGVIKRTYDPAYIKDPREIGLLDAQGKPVTPKAPPPGPAPPPAIKPQDIQPSDSEKSP